MNDEGAVGTVGVGFRTGVSFAFCAAVAFGVGFRTGAGLAFGVAFAFGVGFAFGVDFTFGVAFVETADRILTEKALLTVRWLFVVHR